MRAKNARANHRLHSLHAFGVQTAKLQMHPEGVLKRAMLRDYFGLVRNRAVLTVLALVALNAVLLSGELKAGRFDLNDSVFHYTLIDRMVQAIERGENPLDCWVSEWTLGYPVPRTYQILAHVSIAFLYLLLGKTISVLTLFIWSRYLFIVFFPLTVYVAARLLMLRPAVALASAAAAPLIATNGLYGLELGSYLWRGNGLFTQALAMHLLLLTLGFGFRAMRGKSSPITVGLLLGLTFLSHFIFGFISAISLVLLTVIPNLLPLRMRVTRTAAAALTSMAVSAFQLVPMLLDGWLINKSQWEPQWKWDSFGAPYVFQTLIQGDLFDAGRWPVLSLLALLGTVMCVVRVRNSFEAKDAPAETPKAAYAFLLYGAFLWLLLFCGRPAWGVVFEILGAGNIQLHRLIGGVHGFSIFLAGIGLGTLWSWLTSGRFRYRRALAAIVVIAALFPALRERLAFLEQNTEWGETNLAALDRERTEVSQVLSTVNSLPGRAYSGLAAAWGNQFRVGDVPFYALLSTNHIPAVAFLYHAMAPTSDLMVWFDEINPAHYRLFNISTIVSPESRQAPPFVTAKAAIGRFRVYQAPANGYFDIVHVPYAVRTYPENFYGTSHDWLKSNWVSRLNHLLLDIGGKGTAEIPYLAYGQTLPEVDGAFDLGFVSGEQRNGENYQATVQLQRAAHVLFKMTYHRNWRAIVDGTPQKPLMLTPGFMGVRLEPGQHTVQFRYEPGPLKMLLLIAGVMTLAAGLVAERRYTLNPVDLALERATSKAQRHLGYVNSSISNHAGAPKEGLSASHGWPLVSRYFTLRYAGLIRLAGLTALAVPVAVPLLTSQLVSGHDAFSYVPRLVEFHENIRYGILLPRWAPDLGSGAGQPLFLFNPPLLYYLAEVWYLLGFQATTAFNIVSVGVVIASAVFMYLFGRLYFGEAGGWLGAAAYVYAPYFHVELFVRQALAEFVAFPFYPLALYGFGHFVRHSDRRFLLVGAAALAGVFLSHNAAALLFVPILLAFVVMHAWLARSWKLLGQQLAGFGLGLGLSAFVWLPVLTEMEHAHIERLREGYLNFANHFVYAHQFLAANWGFGLSVAGDQDGISFSLGWSHMLLATLAVVLSRRQENPKDRRITRLFAWVIVVYCLIMTPAAVWVWDRISLLQVIEFPWRMLGPVGLCVAFVVASLPPAFERLRRPAWLRIAVALLILPNLNHLRAERYYRLVPADWTPQQIAGRGVSVATKEEYEPRSVITRPGYQMEKLRVVAGAAKPSLLVMNPVAWSAEIDAVEDSIIQANLFYFPGWVAKLDGTGVPVSVAPNTGEIQVRVPKGTHRFRLEFQRTTPRLVGEGIALLAVIVLVGVAAPRKRNSA